MLIAVVIFVGIIDEGMGGVVAPEVKSSWFKCKGISLVISCEPVKLFEN